VKAVTLHCPPADIPAFSGNRVSDSATFRHGVNDETLTPHVPFWHGHPEVRILQRAAATAARHGPSAALLSPAQIAGAIIETQVLVSVFNRLGHEARPPFRWRCLGMGDSIHAALVRYFEQVAK